ncbi:hypothetical protein [Haloarcula sediminis]|uniref:hypothetical protein n=1 Tax=Haloarcula sediminis TaxID=3111777 RepID=UPI002D768F5F|nr:hypothetical protein [Haloarcula sp. CK38]
MTRKIYVITHGDGTRWALQKAHEHFAAVGKSNCLEMIAFDTGPIDQSNVPDGVTTQVLANGHRFERRAIQRTDDGTVPYMHGVSLVAQSGAARERAIGRAKAEYDIEQYIRRLKTETHADLQDNEEISEAIIVPMAALAGGTGSGQAVYSSLVCKQIVQQIKNDSDVDATVRLAGVMTVSKLEYQRQTMPVSFGEKRLNTNNALRELRVLQGRSRHDPPREVKLPMSPADEGAPDTLPVETPVLDTLFLVPLDEGKAPATRVHDEARDHREAVNLTIAMLLLALNEISVDGLENPFKPDGQLGEEIHTVSFADVRAPLEAAKEFLHQQQTRDKLAQKMGIDPEDYVRLSEVADRVSIGQSELLERLQKTDDPPSIVDEYEIITPDGDDEGRELDELLVALADQVADSEQIHELVAERGLLEALLKADFEPGVLPEAVSKGPFVEVAKQGLEWVTSVNLERQTVDDIGDKEDTLARNVATGSGPRNRRSAFRYVFRSTVEAYLSKLVEEHPFWDENAAALAEKREWVPNDVHGLDEMDPEECFERGVRPAIEAEMTDIEESLDNTSRGRVLKRRKLQKELDKLEGRLDELVDLYRSVSSLQKLHSQVHESQLPEAKRGVTDTRDDIESKITELRKERRKERISLRDAQAELDTFRQKLDTTDTQTVDRLSFDVDSLSDIGSESLENVETIAELERRGLVDDAHIAERLNQMLVDRLREPLTDYERKNATGTPTNMLALLTHQDNEPLMSIGGDKAPDVESTRDTQFDTDLPVGGVDRKFSIGLLAIHSNVNLADASELRWINEQRCMGRLEEKLAGLDDVSRDDQVAWPELLADHESGHVDSERVEADGGGDW